MPGKQHLTAASVVAIVGFGACGCKLASDLDVTFGRYHKFGSEVRILAGFEETEGTKPPAPLRKYIDR